MHIATCGKIAAATDSITWFEIDCYGCAVLLRQTVLRSWALNQHARVQQHHDASQLILATLSALASILDNFYHNKLHQTYTQH